MKKKNPNWRVFLGAFQGMFKSIVWGIFHVPGDKNIREYCFPNLILLGQCQYIKRSTCSTKLVDQLLLSVIVDLRSVAI
jgi:hypothetical protein